MKKLIAIILLITTLMLSLTLFTSCHEDEVGKIRVGYLTGPTGMGMAKLIHDSTAEGAESNYTFEKFTSTVKAKDALVGGLVDIICYPTNDAVDYLNNVDNNATVLAINTLSSLFLVTDATTTVNSFEELNGKTIYTCKAGTPRIVLQKLIDLYDIDATISYTVDGVEMNSPENLKDKIIAGAVDIALAPEPIVTVATLNNKTYSIDLSLGSVWSEKIDTPMAMGCIIANKDFVNKNKNVVKDFLNDYKASIEFISDRNNIETSAQYIADAGIMGAVPPAKKALLNLGNAISYMDGNEMKNTLINFYKAMDIALPDDDFYYKK